MNKRTFEHPDNYRENEEIRSYGKLLRRSQFVVLLFYCSVISPSLAQNPTGGERNQTIDSLATRLQQNLHDTDRVNTLNVLAWEYIYSNPDTALYFGRLQLDFSIRSNNKKSEGQAYNLMGVSQWVAGNYPKALKHMFQGLKIRKEIDDKKGVASAYNNIALIYSEQKELSKALYYNKQSMAIREKLGNQGDLAVSYDNIAIIFKWLADSTYKGIKQAPDNRYDTAMAYYLKSLSIREQLDGQPLLSGSYNNIGALYADLKNYEEAITYFKKALRIQQILGDKRKIITIYLNISRLKLNLGSDINNEVLPMAIKAYDLAKEINAKWYIRKMAEFIDHLYKRENNYKQALAYSKVKLAYKDSMFNEEKSKEIGKLEATYEMEIAEREQKRLAEEQESLLAEAQRRRDNLQYSGILIFLVLVFAGVFALGRFSIPIRLAEGMIFFSFLLFFEFTLVLLDPYIEQYSSGAPAIKLGFNAVLAALIFPLHKLFEKLLKERLVKNKMK